MKTYLLTMATCSVFFVVAAASAQTPTHDTSLTANTVYMKDCAKCHGKNAEGRHFGGPSLVCEKTAATPTDDLHKIIADGKGHMPKFANKLTAEEIDALVQEIQALNKH